MRSRSTPKLTDELAREVCQRTASAVTISGSIAALGSQYVLELRAVNCRSGDLLADEHVTAVGRGASVQDAHEGIKALATDYDLGIAHDLRVNFCPYPVYLRAEAYLAAHQGAAAAAEFQKVLDHPGLVVNQPIGALAHLGVARAYALEARGTAAPSLRSGQAPAAKTQVSAAATGGTPVPQPGALAKARIAYQDFLALWKEADPDIPILRQAKGEYARLH